MRALCVILLINVLITGVAFPANAGRAELLLYFTGDVQGNFEPCGCAGGPTGGLARRRGYVESVTREGSQPFLNVDAGNYFAEPGPEAEAVNALMLDSLRRLPMAVLNLGINDLHWWPDLSSGSTPAKVISTNLVPRRSSLVAPERFAVVESVVDGVSRPVRIGFLGLADPLRVKPNSGFRGLDPLQAVAEVKAEVMKQADFLVVLWDTLRPQGEIPPDWVVARLAEEHPEVRLIITTEPRFVIYKPLRIGLATVVSSVERGRFLGEARLQFDAAGKLDQVAVEFVEMKNGVPEDPALLELQHRLSSRLR